MLTAAAVVIALAALGGVAMATVHFSSRGERLPPAPLAIVHGVLMASGLVLLVLTVAERGLSWASAAGLATIAFLIAAAVGIGMLRSHLRDRRLPSPAVLVHALLGVVAFLLLVAFLVRAGAGAPI